MKLGDAISTVATPIARAIHSDCIDPDTKQLRPESRCAKAKQSLNEGRYADAFYDRFWPTKRNKNKMHFIVTENISQPYTIEAETAEAAIKARETGEGIPLPSRSVSRHVQVRTQPPQRPVATQVELPKNE